MPGVYVCGELVDVFGRIGGFSEWGLCFGVGSVRAGGWRALMQRCTAVGRMPDAVLICLRSCYTCVRSCLPVCSSLTDFYWAWLSGRLAGLSAAEAAAGSPRQASSSAGVVGA